MRCLRLAEANAIVVHGLGAFGWQIPLDRTVVAAGWVGLIANRFRISTTRSGGHRLVRAILVRQMIDILVWPVLPVSGFGGRSRWPLPARALAVILRLSHAVSIETGVVGVMIVETVSRGIAVSGVILGVFGSLRLRAIPVVAIRPEPWLPGWMVAISTTPRSSRIRLGSEHHRLPRVTPINCGFEAANGVQRPFPAIARRVRLVRISDRIAICVLVGDRP